MKDPRVTVSYLYAHAVKVCTHLSSEYICIYAHTCMYIHVYVLGGNADSSILKLPNVLESASQLVLVLLQ